MDKPTRKEKIEHLMRKTYPHKRYTLRNGKIVQNWQHPNAKIFLAELEDQPDNVIDSLYADCLRESDYQAELATIRRNAAPGEYQPYDRK